LKTHEKKFSLTKQFSFDILHAPFGDGAFLPLYYKLPIQAREKGGEFMRVGDVVRASVNYPRNKKLNGEYVGRVTEIGCFRSGFAYFKLDSFPKPLPNSSNYTKIEILKRR